MTRSAMQILSEHRKKVTRAIVLNIITLILTAPGASYANSSDLRLIKIPASSCARFTDIGQTPDALISGPDIISLRSRTPGTNDDVHFSCPITIAKGAISQIKVYYSDSDGANNSADIRIGIDEAS